VCLMMLSGEGKRLGRKEGGIRGRVGGERQGGGGSSNDKRGSENHFSSLRPTCPCGCVAAWFAWVHQCEGAWVHGCVDVWVLGSNLEYVHRIMIRKELNTGSG